MPGFVEFHLLKGPEAEDHTLYASHTVWKNRATFEAWTKSDAFRAAHASAGEKKAALPWSPAVGGVRDHSDGRKRQDKDGVVLTSGAQTRAIVSDELRFSLSVHNESIARWHRLALHSSSELCFDS